MGVAVGAAAGVGVGAGVGAGVGVGAGRAASSIVCSTASTTPSGIRFIPLKGSASFKDLRMSIKAWPALGLVASDLICGVTRVTQVSSSALGGQIRLSAKSPLVKNSCLTN